VSRGNQVSLTKAAVVKAADRKRVAQATLDQLLIDCGDMLLTEDEMTGLQGALPKLFELAEDMGCSEKPLSEWSKEEVMRFLVIAIRAAVPLRVVSFTLATDDGSAPF
jgi:hypothetical protein